MPANVPKSALLGGTIKRLGRKRPRKNLADDWSEDVELPDSEYLKLKDPNERNFPESLRHINSTVTSPVKSSPSPFWGDSLHPALTSLDILRDENDELDTGDVPTIKLPKARSSRQTTPIKHGHWADTAGEDIEPFDQGFELPAGNVPLNLPSRKSNTATPSPFPDDFDIDWSEGSIGVRFGGTARDRRSNPSSSVSIASPSVSSCLTGESEDDGLDGLVIPEEPLDLETSLKKRQDSKPATTIQPHPEPAKDDAQESRDTDDFFCGLEVEGGSVFTPLNNLALNPNVKCKTERPESPARRSATTITFTNTNNSPRTRIPRPSGHDRPLSTHLETVSESGAPISKFRPSPSRSHGHSSHSSVSSLSASGAMSASPSPKFSSRRLVGTRVSRDSLDGGRTPASQQRLKSKRSMPTMRGINQQSTSVPLPQGSPFYRDSTRQVSASTVRLKPPVDRVGYESKSVDRRTQTPFIPAGAPQNKSHHVTVKNNRPARRTNSESSGEAFHPQGNAPRAAQSDTSPEAVAPKRTLTKPARRRHFGDGSELELFDDLPTSIAVENRFVKNPTGRGAPRSLRGRLSQSQPVPPRAETPTQPPTSITVPKTPGSTPRFARDTNASRNAREQRIASMTMNKNRDITSLPSLSASWKPKSTSRVPSGSATLRSKRDKSTVPGTKPHLIRPMGAGVHEAKCKLMVLFLFFLCSVLMLFSAVNGMHYNPTTFRWEGNDNLVKDFDTPPAKSPKPAPALITNVSAMQNVQVVGGMVFDPQRMCWLKLASQQPATNGAVAVQDEDDVFAGLDDLNETTSSDPPGARTSGAFDDSGFLGSGDDRSGGESSDEWPITEEFDVGPEFIKRQRVEEEKWRRKVDGWVGFRRQKSGDCWRWAIRDLLKSHGTFRAEEFHKA